jgi:hypothetical protein
VNISAASSLAASRPPRRLVPALTALLVTWFAAVVWGAVGGALGAIHPPIIAALVAASIVLPSLAYFRSASLQSLAMRVGLVPLTALHMWRVPAAMAFYAYGLADELPPLFWILAGTGDLLAGIYAAGSLRAVPSPGYFKRFHIFGFADFVVAVGTGLTYTLMQDPRMAPIAQWPMALIPLFGVGLSGTAHLIAFDLLRKDTADGRTK